MVTLPEFFHTFTAKYLSDKPEVIQWLMMFNDLAHRVDDLIDEDKNPELIMATMALSRKVFTHPVYLRFADILDVVDEVINAVYYVSVKWEKSNETWKQLHSDVLRHTGYNMFFSIVYLYCGRQALADIIEDFITYSHDSHLEDFPTVLTKVA